MSWRTLFSFMLVICCLGAAPSRSNTYVAGTVISPTNVTANEDTIYTYLQAGVDTYAPLSIGTASIAANAITSAKILDGTITTADLAFALNPGNTLPSGAVFFMITGSCPAWTTDVSATYSNLFVRVNATAGVQSGSDTHTHTAGTYVGSSHTHSLTDATLAQGAAWSATRGGAADGGDAVTINGFNSQTADSGGGGAITGSSASNSNIPQYVTMKLCKVT